MKKSNKYRFMVVAILLVVMVCTLSGCGQEQGKVNNYYTLTEEQFDQLLDRLDQKQVQEDGQQGSSGEGQEANGETEPELEPEEDEGLMHVNASYLEKTAEVIYFYHSAEEAKANVLDLKWDCKTADICFNVTVNAEVKNVMFSPDNYQNTIPLVVEAKDGVYTFNTGKVQQDKVYCINFQINDAIYYFCIKF